MNQARAAVFLGPDRGCELREFDRPDVQAGEVLVRVRACTVCGSDLHSYRGRRQVPTPTVLGHEVVGEVVALGSAAPLDLSGQPIQPGMRISWAVVVSCGNCFFCRRQLPQKCEHAFKYGHQRLQPGRELAGGLATHCLLVPNTAIAVLPESLTDAIACPASCATATVAAALEAAGSVTDRRVVVVGLGLLGLTAAAMCRIAGADHIIAVDPVEQRRRRAIDFGADATVAPDELPQEVRRLTNGKGADVVLEFSGVPAAWQSVWPQLRMGGRAVFVGAVFPAPPVSLALHELVRRQISMVGVHNYAPRHLREAVRFLDRQCDRFPWKSIVGRWFRLSELASAFDAAENPEWIRVGVRP